MDQIDTQREYLSLSDFKSVSSLFSVHHYPALIVDLLSKLSGLNFKQLAYQRLKLIPQSSQVKLN